MAKRKDKEKAEAKTEKPSLDRKGYEKELERLQGELVKVQLWLQETKKHKIIVIFEPRTRFSSRGFRPSSSRPCSFADPETSPFAAVRPITAMKVWLLPEPLSPTTPRVVPRGIASETPRTASTTPSSVAKATVNASTVSTGSDMPRT